MLSPPRDTNIPITKEFAKRSLKNKPEKRKEKKKQQLQKLWYCKHEAISPRDAPNNRTIGNCASTMEATLNNLPSERIQFTATLAGWSAKEKRQQVLGHCSCTCPAKGRKRLFKDPTPADTLLQPPIVQCHNELDMLGGQIIENSAASAVLCTACEINHTTQTQEQPKPKMHNVARNLNMTMSDTQTHFWYFSCKFFLQIKSNSWLTKKKKKKEGISSD